MHFDVLILGSGQAGVPLATRLAQSGKRVLLAERAAAGGTCINYGCTPTKTMIASARVAHVARTAARFGVKSAPVEVDLAAIVERKDAIARAIETAETAGLLRLLIDPPTERILGAALVGAEAGELLHVFVGLMQAKSSVRALVDVQHVHPTFAEGLQALVMRLPRFALD